MRAFSHLKLGARIIVGSLGLVSTLIIVTGIAFTFAYWQKILPGVEINGIGVGNMTAEQAAKAVDNKAQQTDFKLKVRYQDREWQTTGVELGLKPNTLKTVNQAWSLGRQGNLIERVGLAWKSFFQGQKFDLVVDEDGEKLNSWTAAIAKDIDIPLVKPSFNLTDDKLIYVTGKDGLTTDRDGLAQILRQRAARLSTEDVNLPVSRLSVRVDDEKLKAAKQAAENLTKKSLKLILDGDSWIVGDGELIGFVSVANGGGFDESAILEKVDSLTQGIDHQPQNAALQFSDGKVSVFRPGKDGVMVDRLKLLTAITQSYEQFNDKTEVEIEIPVSRTPPEIATEDVNNLGIKELLGRGKSTYTHSIPNRIANVALAASRINGVLVPPGVEFSFNSSVGDISRATGYLSAYVIENGRTVLGDGGGVCQVSTTVFRAAMAAGLPITDRKAHAYRVGYYEQDSLPGIDATVYAGSADLKFKNDTPNNILIQTVTNSQTQKMTVEIYGTSDGRKSTVTTPKVWGQSPPPPTLYQDDPTLPVGTLKQVDWAAAGAKVSFDYKVIRDGQEIFNKTFFSNYRPWQAVYLKGTRT